jgi:hypothetical protein
VEAWYYLGDRIFHSGWALGMRLEQVRERAWAAFDRGLEVDPDFGPIVTHKFDQAWLEDDFERFEALAEDDFERFKALADSYPDIAARNVHATLTVAARRGDSAAVQQWFGLADTMSFDQVAGTGFGMRFAGSADLGIRAYELALGKATTAAERLSTLRSWRRTHWVAGQPSSAAQMTERIQRELGRDPVGDYRPIDAALFLDGDTAQASDAARDIAQALEAEGIEPGAGLPRSGVSSGSAFRLCYLGLWRAHRGEAAEAEAIAAQLGRISETGDPYPALHGGLCSLEVRGLLAAPAERRVIAERLDSIAAAGPDVGSNGRNRVNLVLTQLFRSLDEPQRALGAAMRWDMFGGSAQALFREAGRQAAAVGDSALAVQYLDWYLRTRGGAEPHLRAADDALRAELARLVGEGR